MSNPSLLKQLIWLVVFSISMAYLESAVVVYLREIYYPDGFSFPLRPLDSDIFITEFLREIATIVMLMGISVLTGKSSSQRFAFFLLSFAIWDIFYYVFLYLLLGWPTSLLTWDILFLVPIPWVGPVITPVIVSVIMILMASSLIYHSKQLNRTQWILSILGSLVVILSWVLDYWNYSSQFSNGLWTLSSESYVPKSFNWYIFLLGIVLLMAATISHYIGNKRNSFTSDR